ncbi:hypothetical protein [Streptomyces sp. NPDC001492]
MTATSIPRHLRCTWDHECGRGRVEALEARVKALADKHPLYAGL